MPASTRNSQMICSGFNRTVLRNTDIFLDDAYEQGNASSRVASKKHEP